MYTAASFKFSIKTIAHIKQISRPWNNFNYVGRKSSVIQKNAVFSGALKNATEYISREFIK